MIPALRLLAVSPTGLFSGAERVLVDSLLAAQARGWDVRCLSPAGTLADELLKLGIPVLNVPDMKLGSGPRVFAGLALALRWLAAARPLRSAARSADVVLLNGALTLPALRMAHIKAPSCWLVHDVLVRRDLRLLVRAAAPALTLAVAVSDAAAAYPSSLGVATKVARNGTRWPVAAAFGPATGEPPVVGLSAALTSWKGQHLLLEAAAELPREVVIELMGGHFPKDASYVARLRARAERPDLAGRIRFLGRLDDPLARMRGWTVAVNASVEPEAAPLAVLEAMSLGLPIVATAHGGTTEVLGEAGEGVPPGDAAALAAAIRGLLAQPDLAARRGAAGRAAVAKDYALALTTERFLDLIEELGSGASRDRMASRRRRRRHRGLAPREPVPVAARAGG